MPTKQLHEFTVKGGGLFPFDMLRYDQCWPKSESTDSAAIERTTRHGHGGTEEVTLVGLNSPTQGRWQSFGWRVIERAAKAA